jgi:Cupin-like domain
VFAPNSLERNEQMTIARLLKSIPSYSRSSLSSLLPTLLHSNEPVILSQCFQDMAAIQRWPHQSYFSKFSHQPIEIEVSALDTPGYGERHETALGEYLTLLSHSLPYHVYMAQFPLFERIPQLQEDVSTPLIREILQGGEVYSTSTWIGKRSVTPLHHDPKSLTNFFVQICGRKEFRIFSPSISRDGLDVGEGTLANTAHVDVWNKDIGEGFEGTLSAGDGILLPRGWWHSVRSIEDELTISVNWWFKLNKNEIS